MLRKPGHFVNGSVLQECEMYAQFPLFHFQNTFKFHSAEYSDCYIVTINKGKLTAEQ